MTLENHNAFGPENRTDTNPPKSPVAHSGKAPGKAKETPHTEYAGTSLETAILRGDISNTTPETPYDGFNHEDAEPTPGERADWDQAREDVRRSHMPESSSKANKLPKWLIPSAVGFAALSVVGGGVAVNVNASAEKTPTTEPTVEASVIPGQTVAPTEAPVVNPTPQPTDIPTSSFEPTPVETSEPVAYESKSTTEGKPASPDQIIAGDHFMPFQRDQEQDISVENIEIPVTLEAQDLARAILHRTTAWDMAGAMPSMVNHDDNYTMTLEAYTEKISQENATIFTEALISTPISPEMQSEIARFTATNKLNLGGYQQTYDPAGYNPENLESIWVYGVLDGDGSVAFNQTGDNTWKLTYDVISYNNTDKNIAPDNEVLINGYQSHTEVSLIEDGDHWKIQTIKFSPN